MTGLFHKHEFTIALSENCLDLAHVGVLGLLAIDRSNPLPTMQHQATFRTAASFMPKSHPKSSANLKMVLDCPGLCFQNLYQNGPPKKYRIESHLPGFPSPNLTLEFDYQSRTQVRNICRLVPYIIGRVMGLRSLTLVCLN